MVAASVSNELQRVVAIRESIKSVVSCAFRVNVLGLNAILLAKKFGDAASGFGVISNELRQFGRELTDEMFQLNEASASLVELASRQMRLVRQQGLLQRAAGEEPPRASLQEALQRHESRARQVERAVRDTLQQMSEFVALAYQSCLFGTVIARAARIEAAHAGSSGQVLTSTSNEFAEHVDRVLGSLEQLRQVTGVRA